MAREIAQELAGRGVLVQVNTENSQQVAARFGVRGIPAFFALKRGEPVASLAGTRPKEEIIRWFFDAVR